MRCGLVGYGAGGRIFHAPFIEAAEGVELVGVVTRSAQRRAQLAADRPDMAVYDSLADLLAAGVDVVTITTPPQTRRDLVLEALSAGVHVIADKPVAPSAEAARDLAAVAADAGLRLGAYHQRRFDADLQTVRGLIEAGRLGEVWRFHSRFDLDEPHGLEPGPAGGLLRDLGSHLVDQVLWLFGPAIRVHAHLDHVELPAGRTDCGFVICIDHAGGTTSYLSASKLNHITSRTLRIYGSEGSYRATSCDVQARDIRRGRTPSQDAESWGYEPPQHWGQLDTGGGTQTIPSAQGRYQDYYTRFAEAVATGGPLPVEFEEAAAVLDVLDAARVSAAGQRVVTL